ncbi:MAG TPA: hypothetical protein PLI18_19635 [Pirellulaceae bacterium]|nr:hypothetical protein [Pirellulaceae bacterium]
MISRRVLGRMGLAALLGGSVLGSRGLAQESQENQDLRGTHVLTGGFLHNMQFYMVIGEGGSPAAALECAQDLASFVVHGTCNGPKVDFMYQFESTRPGDPTECICPPTWLAHGDSSWKFRFLLESLDKKSSLYRDFFVVAVTVDLARKVALEQAKLAAVHLLGTDATAALDE